MTNKKYDNSALCRIADVLENIYDILQLESEHDMTFEEARKSIFHGKSRDWIYYYVFDKHPEVLTSHGGWITDPSGRGSRIVVTDSLRAKKWSLNVTDVDWTAPEPKNVA